MFEATGFFFKNAYFPCQLRRLSLLPQCRNDFQYGGVSILSFVHNESIPVGHALFVAFTFKFAVSTSQDDSVSLEEEK